MAAMTLIVIVIYAMHLTSVHGNWLPNMLEGLKHSEEACVPFSANNFYTFMGSPTKLKRSPGDSATCKEEYVECKSTPECCSRMLCARIGPYPSVCLSKDAKLPMKEEEYGCKKERAECSGDDKCCGEASCSRLGADPFLCLSSEGEKKARETINYGLEPLPGDNPNCITRRKKCERSEDCCANMRCGKLYRKCYPE